MVSPDPDVLLAERIKQLKLTKGSRPSSTALYSKAVLVKSLARRYSGEGCCTHDIITSCCHSGGTSVRFVGEKKQGVPPPNAACRGHFHSYQHATIKQKPCGWGGKFTHFHLRRAFYFLRLLQIPFISLITNTERRILLNLQKKHSDYFCPSWELGRSNPSCQKPKAWPCLSEELQAQRQTCLMYLYLTEGGR